MTSPVPADPMDRAAERIVEDVPVEIEEQPAGGETVRGPVGQVPVRAEENTGQRQ